jgi:hypothetical protein
MKTLRKFYLLAILLPLLTTPSCEILEQTAQVQRLSQCTFDVHSVDKIKLAGINIQQGMSYSDLNTSQIMSLTGALFRKELPLDFNLNVKVDNPNDKLAAMSRMDYIVFVDGVELIAGVFNERIEIAPGGSSIVPMDLHLDLFKALSGEAGDALINLAFKLSGSESRPTELLFKVKPYINVGGSQLAYPGYLNVNHTLN